jgi:hypothetical protein
MLGGFADGNSECRKGQVLFLNPKGHTVWYLEMRELERQEVNKPE